MSGNGRKSPRKAKTRPKVSGREVQADRLMRLLRAEWHGRAGTDGRK